VLRPAVHLIARPAALQHSAPRRVERGSLARLWRCAGVSLGETRRQRQGAAPRSQGALPQIREGKEVPAQCELLVIPCSVGIGTTLNVALTGLVIAERTIEEAVVLPGGLELLFAPRLCKFIH
jgi:hypothetical protein